MNKKTVIIPLFLIFLFVNVTVIAVARTEKRVALVWGNAVYEGWENLPVCINDADAVGKTLYELGFDTIMLKDGTRFDMNESLRRFEKKCEGADVAVFFYSGHAFNKSSNYFLVPSKTEIDYTNPRTADCYPAQSLVDGMAKNAKLSILFFDACRVTGGEMGSVKGISVPTDIGSIMSNDKTPRGCTLCYATNQEHKALTGKEGDLSPFTRVLVSHLPDTLEFREVWYRIMDEVNALTEEQQKPNWENPYINDFHFNLTNEAPLDLAHDYNIDMGIPCDELYGKYLEVVAELELTKTKLNIATTDIERAENIQSEEGEITKPNNNQTKPSSKISLQIQEAASKKKSGIDISKHQGEINWTILQENNKDIKFVYIKATEGSDYVDPRYNYNITNARNSGIKVGSYHFLSTRSPISTQFENFIKTVKIEDQDLIPLIDCETRANWSSQQLRDSLRLFANMVEQYFGCKPMIFTSEKFFTINLGSTFADYPLMIAKYSNVEPKIGCDWILWQFSDRCHISGVQGNQGLVDVSVFNKKKSIDDILLKPK